MKKAPELTPNPQEDRGICCPKCGCRHFWVVYPRATWGQRIVRRRECRHCGRRITTTEKHLA